jgi:ribosomal protein S18 acetylase RimI-like enzyme
VSVSPVRVVPADPGDAPVLSDVVATSFADLPASGWLVPDPAERARIFPDYFRILVDLAFAGGTVHTTPERDAVALWLPVGVGDELPPADYGARLAAVAGPWTARFQAFDELLEKGHPHAEPHHHLAILGVRRERQGQGVGSALLTAHHRVLDEAATPLPAYVEASSEGSRRLYARHGYRDMESVLRYPDGISDRPMMYPMWRSAAG